MKSEFYPAIEKSELFGRGFLVKKSTHTRGSTLDLTIIKSPRQHKAGAAAETERKYGLDMGTRFDVFDERSFTFSDKISREQQENRQFLVEIMTQNGFENFTMEWWHYTLVDEPYIDTYFDFLP
jgi:D-alanyl-D-alanine dipeptidase